MHTHVHEKAFFHVTCEWTRKTIVGPVDKHLGVLTRNRQREKNEAKEATYIITTYISVEISYSGDIGRAIVSNLQLYYFGESRGYRSIKQNHSSAYSLTHFNIYVHK